MDAHEAILEIEFYHYVGSDSLWFETRVDDPAIPNSLPADFRFKCSVLKGIYNNETGKDKH